MRKNIFILSFVFLVFSSFVHADLTTDNLLYVSMDSDDETGTTMADLSVNGNDLTCTMDSNCDLVSGGKINNKSDFDGSNDFMNLDSFADISALEEFSISYWVEVDTNNGEYGGVMLGSRVSGFVHLSFHHNNGKMVGGVITANQVEYGGVYTDSAISLDTLYHVVFTVSNFGATRTLYLNNVEQTTDTFVSGTPTFAECNGGYGDDLHVGATDRNVPDNSIDNYLDGYIDELSIWDKELTSAEVGELYNSGTGYNFYTIVNVLPIVEIKTPVNNSHTNDDPISITYNVTDTDNELINCTIAINGTNVTTHSNINASLSILKEYNLTTGEGEKNLSVICYDAVGSHNDSTNFVVDRVSPDWEIRTISESNTTIIDRSVSSYIYFNDSVDDTYLFSYNVSLFYPNGSIWFSNQTIDLNVTRFNYTFNQTITPTQPNGTYSINYYAEDDHTAKEIPEYYNEVLQDGLRFSFDDYYIDVKSDNPNTLKDLQTTKLVDRYTFDFDYKTPKNIRIYSLRSDEKIYYRNGLYEFPVFVIGKNWVDFNIEESGTTYKIFKKSDYWYQIEIEKLNPSTLDNIKSLGGLNIVNETYTFQIKENSAPIIINWTPNQNFSVSDGVNQTFFTNATDADNDTISYEYFFNGVSQGTSQTLVLLTPHSSHGVNNMTVIATDGGKSDTFTWNVNITHTAVPPEVISLARTPTSTWYTNTGGAFVCIGIDGDNETNLSALVGEIDYRSSVLWTSLNTTNNGSGTFTASLDLSSLETETLDVRCRVSDSDYGYSNYTQINNIVTVQAEYFSVGNISNIAPTSGNRNYVIPVTCSAESFGTIPSYKLIYDIDYYYNNSWNNLSNNLFNKALFDMSIMDYGENVNFRCAVDDGVNKTDYKVGGNVTRAHINDLFMYNKGQDEVMKARKPYFKGLMADFYNEPNISIIASFADCNGDDYWDHYYPYNDSRNSTKEDFVCLNEKGIVRHTVGILIEKTGINNLFCGDKTEGVCRIERNYEVLVK